MGNEGYLGFFFQVFFFLLEGGVTGRESYKEVKASPLPAVDS